MLSTKTLHEIVGMPKKEVESHLANMARIHPNTVFEHVQTLVKMHKWELALIGLAFLVDGKAAKVPAPQPVKATDLPFPSNTQGELF